MLKGVNEGEVFSTRITINDDPNNNTIKNILSDIMKEKAKPSVSLDSVALDLESDMQCQDVTNNNDVIVSKNKNICTYLLVITCILSPIIIVAIVFYYLVAY